MTPLIQVVTATAIVLMIVGTPLVKILIKHYHKG